MSYADSLLADGERIAMRTRQHWLAVVLEARRAILMVAGALVVLYLILTTRPSGVIGDILGGITLVLAVVGLAWIGLVVLNWWVEEYLVTNRRVMKVDGLINKHAADSSLEKINDAVLDQNLFGRIFRFADLDILTASDSQVDKFRMMADAIAFKKEMLDQKHRLGLEGMTPPVSQPLRVADPSPPQPAPAAPGSREMSSAEVTQALANLADLRDRGAVSAGEFEAKKTDLLGRL